MKLHEVELYTSDVQASQTFYRNIIGLDLNEGASNPGLNVFSADKDSWLDFNTSQHGSKENPVAVSFLVEDLAPIISNLKKDNIPFTDPEVDHTNLPTISLTDPDGNTVILHSKKPLANL